MNAAALLAQYERIVGAPDAVERLRQFIVDLAVRGKLVRSDPHDEPASMLLARLHDAVKQAAAAGDFREPSSFIEIDRASLPFDVPPHWEWARLIEVAKPSYGFAFASAQFNSTQRGMPLIRIRDISGTDTEAYFDGDFDAAYVVRAGDYLVGMDGDFNLRRWRGKDALLNQRVMRINGWRCGIEPEFIRLPLQSILYALHSKTSQTTVKHLSAKQVNGIEVPIPPLAEQHRIVAKVDELMVLCDQLEAARMQRETTRDRLTAATLARLNTPELAASPDGDASSESSLQSDARLALNVLPALTARPDQIKQIRQTVLDLAVRGMLSPQEPSDEPAARLLEKVKRAKLAAHEAEELRARTSVTSPTRSDFNFDFPATWSLAAFDDLFVIVSGVTKGQRIPAAVSVEAPYLRVANVQRGYLNLDVIKSIPVRPSDIKRYALRSGDILMTEGGDWDKLGRAAVWKGKIAGCIHQNHVFRVRSPSSEIVPEWVTTYVNSPLGRGFFENASKQTTNLASINMTQLRGCPIPLPPTEEQHRIVAKVGELMALCDQLEASLTHGENTRSRLLNALLHEALQPSHDNVIDFEAARQRRLSHRQAVTCRIMQRNAGTPGFGRVRAVKIQFLTEAHCGAALGGQWGRANFGPYDDWIRTFEIQAATAGWISTKERALPDGGTRIEYGPLPGLSAKAKEAADALGDMAQEFERMLDLFADLNTEDSEIVATLYAAWNDLLLEGKSVSDAAVITEVREHWHPEKSRFPPAQLQRGLDWLRKNRLVPKGQQPSTRHQGELI